MTHGKLPNRIPFEDVGLVKNWVMPVVGGKVVPSVQRQAQQKPLPKQPHETVETLAPEDVPVAPMKASELREIAESAARDGFNQGYEEGHAKGLVEGEKQGCEQGKLAAYSEHSRTLQQQAQGLAAICEALMAPLASQANALENLVVNLAVQLAQHLLRQELLLRPAAIFPVVQAAFASLPSGARDLKLYLHPEDLVFVSAHAQAMGRDWPCMADTTLSRGSCRLETAQSIVNYRVEDRLAEWLAQSQLRPVSQQAPAVDDHRPAELPLLEREASTEPPISSAAGFDAVQAANNSELAHAELMPPLAVRSDSDNPPDAARAS